MTDLEPTLVAPATPSLDDAHLDVLTDELLVEIDGGGWLIEIHDVPWIGDVYLIPWG